MRIMHVISGPGAGGAEVYVKDLATEMVKRGEDVTIGFIKNAAELGRSREFEEKFLSELDVAGVRHFFIGPAAKRNPLLALRKVHCVAASSRIDIYHSHLTSGIGLGLGLSVPRFYTHHSIVMRLPRLLYRLLARLIDVQIGISARCASALREHSGRSVTLIYNGVKVEKFRAPIRRLPLHGPIKLIAIGRIDPPKNYPLMLQAISLLPPDLRQRIRLAIVGEGQSADVSSIQALIDELNLGTSVELLGNRSDIPELLGGAHLFLMSSVFEGLSIALLEANSSGLPSVTTDAGGCAEVIQDGFNGLVVRTMDPQDFATAIERILRSGDDYSDISRRALERSRLFDLTTAVDEHLSEYRRSLATESNTPP